jgi:cytochrome c oxidase subunit 2
MLEHSDILSGLTPVEGGERVYNVLGCKQCHTLDGVAGVGPTFRDLFGSERSFKDGGRALADENYISTSVLDPQSQIVQGFEPVMPTFKGRIKDQEITALIAFLKSLSEHAPREEAPAAAGAGTP